MSVELIFSVVTAVVTAILGSVLKDGIVPSKYIPLQNLLIGIVSAAIAIAMGLFTNIPMAIFTCLSISMGIGGTYDLLQTKKQ